MGQAFKGCLTSLFHTSLLPTVPTSLLPTDLRTWEGEYPLPYPSPAPHSGRICSSRSHPDPQGTPQDPSFFGPRFRSHFCTAFWTKRYPKMTPKCSKMHPKIVPFAILDFWYRFTPSGPQKSRFWDTPHQDFYQIHTVFTSRIRCRPFRSRHRSTVVSGSLFAQKAIILDTFASQNRSKNVSEINLVF